ncbi:MAG TPA: division/cell wall cluster transcriptional repressor MraZ [Chloroflexota bacterium]|nr:division/cell wall cluster transcriptional repressor MraZ [Chloroflexota bacterium]
MFLGEFEHSLDDRGRIAIPAKFRSGLSDGLVITRGIDPCLWVWPMDEWRRIAQKLTDLSLMQTDARRIHRLMFSGATDCAPDRLGRILVPAFLRDYADLRDAVVIVGLLNRVEIWSGARWREERALAEQEGAQLAEHLFSQGV